MALDPSIPLGFKQPQTESPLNRFAQVIAIQNAGNQNALAQYTLGKAKREDETQNALIAGMKGINSATPEGQQQTFQLLMQNGKYKEAQEFMSASLKRRIDEGKVTEQDLKAAGDRFDRFSAGLAPLAGSVQRGEPVSHDQVFSVLSGLKSQGLIADEQIRSVPMNAFALPEWIKTTVNQTEVGRKAFEPFLPKPVQAGGQWVNTAPLAGQIGAPIAGAPAVGMTAAERSASQNRAFNPDGTPNTAFQQYETGKAAAGASRLTVNNRQESEFGKKVGGELGEMYAGLLRADLAAPSNIGKYQRLQSLLSQVNTGKFTGTTTELKAAAKGLGFDLGAMGIGDDLAPAQAARALSNQLALELRSPAGGAGMPGAMSDADRQFLVQMTPGLENDPAAVPVMIEYRTRLAKREQEVAKMAREYRKKVGKFDEGFFDGLAEWSEKNPLFPEATKQPAARQPAVQPSAPTGFRVLGPERRK